MASPVAVTGCRFCGGELVYEVVRPHRSAAVLMLLVGLVFFCVLWPVAVVLVVVACWMDWKDDPSHLRAAA